MIKQQKKFIFIALAACVLLGALLAVLFSTVWKGGEDAGDGAEFMVPSLAMEEIREISVKNQNYAWRLYRAADGQLFFEGAEFVLPNQNMIAYLRSCVAYLATSGKVENPTSMEEYGLTEEACLASFSVTSMKDETYRVLVGEKLVGGDGYYARLENAQEVYVLSTSLERCLFGDITFFLSAQVAPALSENNYYEIENFKIEHNVRTQEGVETSDVLVEIEKIPQEEVTEKDLSSHRVVFPARYEPNTDLVARIFRSFVTFVGQSVEEYNVVSADTDTFLSVMEKYNLLNEEKTGFHCRVTYTHSGEKIVLYVGRATEDGRAYVYSPDFFIIAGFYADDLAWCEYDVKEFTQAELFARSIADVKSISVEGDNVNTTFTLTHGEKSADLVVRSERGEVKVQDFRQFYNQLLFVKNEEYYEPESGFETKKSLTLTVTLTDGSAQTFVFYDVESLRSYYTVNSEGVFCVKRDYVKKILEDAAKLLSGQTVQSVQYA